MAIREAQLDAPFRGRFENKIAWTKILGRIKFYPLAMPGERPYYYATMPHVEEWHYLVGTEPLGPVPAEQIAKLIAEGALSPSTLVAKRGAAAWEPANDALAYLANLPTTAQSEPNRAFAAAEVRSANATKNAVSSITSISPELTSKPMIRQARAGVRRASLSATLLLVAFGAGATVNWIASKRELQASQMPDAEKIVKDIDGYREDGLRLPRDIDSLSVEQWARLEPYELKAKSESVRALYERYRTARQLEERIAALQRSGFAIPANLVGLNANQMASMPPDQFQQATKSAEIALRNPRRLQ